MGNMVKTALRPSLLLVVGLLGLFPISLEEGHAGKNLIPARIKSRPTLPRSLARVNAAAVLMKDLRADEVLVDVRSNRKLPPASLTKIMSALVILDSGKLEEHVTVTKEAARSRKIRLRIRTGDVFVLKDLLKAMLIKSANDACKAAAIHVSGSEDVFVETMNGYADRLGLEDTHFANACGFDAPEHYSTARDLARLTEIAMAKPVFREIVSTPQTTIESLERHRMYVLRNTNRLLHSVPGVQGVKTGFTSQAGRCLIATVDQGGKQLLLVLLQARPRWRTATKLIQYGLEISSDSAVPAPQQDAYLSPPH